MEEKDSFKRLEELETLLTARKNMTFKSEINGVIADTAEKFLDTLNAEIDDEVKKTSAVLKKSEMPCNCLKENSVRNVIECAAKHLEENSSNGNGLAVIAIVPLADLFAAAN